jgi:hypothetical protein
MKGKGKGKSKQKGKEPQPQTYMGYSVGDVVFVRSLGMCRVVKLFVPPVNGYDLVVEDTRGGRFHIWNAMVSPNKQPSASWFDTQRRRTLTAIARFEPGYQLTIRN